MKQPASDEYPLPYSHAPSRIKTTYVTQKASIARDDIRVPRAFSPTPLAISCPSCPVTTKKSFQHATASNFQPRTITEKRRRKKKKSRHRRGRCVGAAAAAVARALHTLSTREQRVQMRCRSYKNEKKPTGGSDTLAGEGK